MIRYELLDIEKLLKKYNIRNITPTGDEVMFSCPFPEHSRGDRNPSSSINKKDGKYHCFSCGRSGTIANFLADIEQVPLATAKGWLEKSVGGHINKDSSVLKYVQSLLNKEKDDASKEFILDEEVLDTFYVNWERALDAYLHNRLPKELQVPFNRGFTFETLVEHQIGWDKHSERITIPIRNPSGKLVGIKGRAIDPEHKPKYKSIGDKKGNYYGFPTCQTHKYMFGSDKCDGNLIIVEGEFDAMWLRQNSLNGAIALGGTVVSDNQLAIIKDIGQSATLLLDPDKAGDKARRKLLENLIGFMPVRIASLDQDDPNDTEIEKLNQILTEAPSALTHKIKQKTQT